MQDLDQILGSAQSLERADGGTRAALSGVFELQMRLCDILEDVADSLPDRINHGKCQKIAEFIVPLIRRIHRYEEDQLFPAAARNSLSAPAFTATLELFKTEHCEDEYHAEELSEMLRDICMSGTASNPEATGYLLRFIFEATRRHCQHELEFLSPLIRSEATS
jgi:hemerythrin-like domain-containing protein